MKKNIYYYPIFIALILHVLGSCSYDSVQKFFWSIPLSLLLTVIVLGMGEGYAAASFFIAGKLQSRIMFVITMLMCFVSIGASIVGYFVSGIEGASCLWMTCGFVILDIAIFVISLVSLFTVKKK